MKLAVAIHNECGVIFTTAHGNQSVDQLYGNDSISVSFWCQELEHFSFQEDNVKTKKTILCLVQPGLNYSFP